MLDGVRVVRARSLKLLLKEVWRIAIGGLSALAFGHGNERAPGRLPVSLPLEAVRPALIGSRVLPIGFPLVAVNDGSDYLLA